MALGMVGLWHALSKGTEDSPFRPLVSAWLGVPCGLAVAMHQSSQVGPGPVTANALILLLVPIWVGDVAALFVGRAIGRRPLAPKVSPKKTWEGAVANFLACTASAGLLAAMLHAPWWAGAAMGAMAGVVGQVGDLLQSALKRTAGLKDSGVVLPGHGGVLDRLDSAMLAFLPCAQVLLALAPELFSRVR
jgi:phosphatidate cytidylyltransferase